MKVQHSQMTNFLELSKTAEPSSVKSLTQSERKVLLLMLSALKKGDSFLHLEGVDSKKLERMKIKLQTPQKIESTSFIHKVVKAVLNFFGLRTGTGSLLNEINSAENYLKECKERLSSLQLILDSKKEALQGLIEQEGKKEEIELLRQEIEQLSKEFTDLERVVAPKELLKQSYFEAKKSVISSFQKEVPSIIKSAKKKVSSKDAKDLIGKTMDLPSLLSSNLSVNEQFKKDYLRQGFRLQMHDPSKGTFEGYSKRNDSTGAEDYLAFHKEGFDQIFSADEKAWKLFVQGAVTQTPVNALIVPVFQEILINDEGNLRTLKVMEEDVPLIFDTSTPERNVDVEIIRGASGKIEKALIKLRMETPLQTGVLYEGASSPKPLDTIGFIESTMSFELTMTGGKPQIGNLQYNHAFTKEKPLSVSERGEPGFTSSLQKTVRPQEKNGLEAMIDSWRKDLTRKKLSLDPTQKKIDWLEGRIQDLEASRSKVESRPERESMGIIIDRYRAYLEEIRTSV